MARRRLRVAAVAIAISVVLLCAWSIESLTANRNPSTSAERGGHISAVQDPPKSPVTTELAENHDSAISSASEPAPLPSPSPTPTKQCLHYEKLQQLRQEPLSEGKRKFPYSRPDPECRTFQLPSLEKVIERMKGVIKDPDLFRLFENSYPNTLDTTIKSRSYANATDSTTGAILPEVTDEELAFVITGDIDAMWLRDSASQVYSYLPLLEPSDDPDSLASLWRGLINSHSRYIIISPYCHSFQPPPESGVKPSHNGAYSQNNPQPPYDPTQVFDCKWELDSLASFLQISTAYYERTKDLEFFQKYKWVQAVKAAVDAAGAMRLGTYAKDGKVEKSAWTFTGWTNRGSETLTNNGLGNPTKENGMVRSAFRPSDDACIYQLLVPANMMFAKYLEEASLIMEKLEGDEPKNLTSVMREFAFGIRKGIDRDAVVHHRDFGDIWAYEIDGYGGVNLMDDANIPSLLSIPLFEYTHSKFPLPEPAKDDPKRDYAKIYRNTRNFVLSDSNPYFSKGPELSAIGGPHLGPGKGWPMAAIVRSLTAFSIADGDEKGLEEEVKGQLRMVLDSTSGTGVIHESVNAWSQGDWSRAWFGWANGLLGGVGYED
ncbi:Meiotically up-regulated protein 157 protein [Lachnellula occidentalis]|uniref:Meiotically up-regulated protein 157 protein n=1 Tax=Lachnellula occidentalis TaxID=215460 RepID=A0A8H8S4G1_9HELO|nr:Meiotically up-regulated protein 157 protein [Lachnellula occidentalis]